MPISAYVSVMDDWTMLHAALSSVAPYVDEIVVVDGGYRWMLPYYAAAGRDPTRSLPQVEDVLAEFGGTVRRIEGVWENEAAKRTAGFAACRHRWVMRVDADEVFNIEPEALQRFMESDFAVAQADVPIMVTPAHVRRHNLYPQELACVLFDSRRIAPAAHLSYLWLVLPDDERALLQPIEPGLVSPEVVAFIAHLTHWRRPETAVSRARFYVLNYHRSLGTLPLHIEMPADRGFDLLFERVGPAVWDTLLLSHAIVAGVPDLDGCQLTAPPPSIACNPALGRLYSAYLDGLAGLNETLTAVGRSIAAGEPLCIDISTPRQIAVRHETLVLRFSHPVIKVEAHVVTLLDRAPWQTRAQPHQVVEGDTVRLALGDAMPCLRRSLTVTVWCDTHNAIIHVQALLQPVGEPGEAA